MMAETLTQSVSAFFEHTELLPGLSLGVHAGGVSCECFLRFSLCTGERSPCACKIASCTGQHVSTSGEVDGFSHVRLRLTSLSNE